MDNEYQKQYQDHLDYIGGFDSMSVYWCGWCNDEFDTDVMFGDLCESCYRKAREYIPR